MRILLPVDGSVHSDAATDEIVKRPWPRNSEIKVITVAEIPVMVGIEPWVASPEYLEVIEKGVRSTAQDLISKAITRLNAVDDKTLKVSTEIIEGVPKQVIVDEVEKWNADLVVMGSRGLGAWSRLLLGSVSSAVVHHAKCSVEIVRIHKPK